MDFSPKNNSINMTWDDFKLRNLIVFKENT